MSPFEIYFSIVFIVNVALGIGVFGTNYKRTVNQLYLTLSCIIAIWLTLNWAILHAQDAVIAKRLVQFATAIAIFIPASCHLLRLSILHADDSWWSCIVRGRKLLATCLAISILCFTPYLVLDVTLSSTNDTASQVTEPIYGWAYFIFALLFIGLVLSLLITFANDRKNLHGFQRIELEFITIGYCMALGTGTLCGVMVTIFTGSSQTVPMANASSILALTLIISYGIATKRILGIATILRKITAYGLLACYLVSIYIIIWQGLLWVLRKWELESEIVPQIIATLTVAFTMAPMQGRLQRFSTKLIAAKTMDVAATMRQAGNIFQTVSTSNALQDQFSLLLAEALKSEFIAIFTLSDNSYRHSNISSKLPELPAFSETDATVELIQKTRDPVYRDSLTRSRPNERIKSAIQQMDENNISVMVGIFSKTELTGFVVFGPRTGGRIYDKTEQDALQLLCDQFAVALENAQLYTEVQDSKIRNEIMLDQLVSGVIVANPERKISLFNHEAQRITGIEEYAAIGKDISDLPKPICLALETTLENRMGDRNVEARLFEQDETRKSLSIRMGTTYLLGHDQKPMGALLVFTDMTELKTLEEQVRRSDQLSSVGTLAAGMAHEIKNPLVTIKTFTQLLPERYSDDDFRQEFSSLVAHEVSRIDGIVNELLSFSKPTKPHLIPINLHDVIGQILKLTREQMAQKNIAINDNRHAEHDHIMGDAKLLSQALINLTLNAVEAIGHEGTITIGTTNCEYHFANGEGPDQSIVRECVRLQISDSGQGIAPDHIKKIFDPFFTRKSEGTGMGLSVAHGIIQEHHAAIDVESEIGKGSTFHIYIPLIEEEVA
jgi:two-component system nitrogen regulation sensor histidine kinase GlnL